MIMNHAVHLEIDLINLSIRLSYLWKPRKAELTVEILLKESSFTKKKKKIIRQVFIDFKKKCMQG